VTKENMMKRNYTIDGFGDCYGPKRTKTYAEIRAGRLIAVRCGRRTYIRHDDAEAWLANLSKLDA
jgi:hypothetical protein